MFANFLKVTLRNLYREKMYAVINIGGLSIAIACCIILGIYLRSELTYDRHNTKYRQIFRVVNEFNSNGKSDSYPLTSKFLGPMLKKDYPEIKGFVRFRSIGEDIVLPGDRVIDCNVYMADVNIFDVFTHNIIYGDPKTALKDPQSVAVSESFARKYFGDTNPIGETIFVEKNILKITLIFADLPENSHLKYDMLISYNFDEKDYSDDVTEYSIRLWRGSDFTYLLMPEDYDSRDFKVICDSFYARYMEAFGKELNSTYRFWLEPLADIHLKSDVGFDLPTANKFYLYGFTAVALFILLVACINYMNLATARAAKRAKEVGMQKILGAGRMRLMLQFLGESIFFTLIAMFLGLVLVEVAFNITSINGLLDKPLALNLGNEPGLLGWMLVFSLVLGFISGSYPALYLSALPPLSALMSDHRTNTGNIRLRELLVLIQFIISVSVIASALLMALQMRYVSHKSLGYITKNRVIITLRGADLIEKTPAIKKELLKNSSILGVSLISNRFGHQIPLNQAQIDNNDGVQEKTPLKWLQVGDDFIEVMGMELVAGRGFSKELLTDKKTAFVVNETMVKKMGWDDPLDKRIQLPFVVDGRVIGVVKDFHFASLHSQVEPFALNIASGNVYIPDYLLSSIRMFMVLNIKGDDIAGTLSFLKNKFAEFDPKHPFEIEFLDNALNKLYFSEQRLMKLICIFAGVCILISCMGLFGLSAFTTEQRTKEIGIRKVLGATTWQIITMLSRNIILLVLGGAIIGSLVAYYAMDEWLTSFAYRTVINPLVFLLSALLAAGVAFITVVLQSYKTARANPVEALRYE